MTPLTHHDILRWIEPFTRRGRQVDLAASQRLERRIVFKPVDPGGDGALAGLRETLQMVVSESGRLQLTRVLALPGGLQAQLHAEGAQAAELLARIEAVPPQRQFVHGAGFTLALSHDAPGDAAHLVLTRAEARFADLVLTMRVPALHGIPAEIELLTPADAALDLPDDLLAVLGWRWPLLTRFKDGWRGSLRLRGRGAERSQDAEFRLAQVAPHLAQTLAEPPPRFHERQRAARWRVVGRRSLPLLACVALLSGAMAVPSLGLAQNSIFRMLIFHAPPLLLVLVFCLHEMPRIEIPPWPRPARARAGWRRPRNDAAVQPG